MYARSPRRYCESPVGSDSFLRRILNALWRYSISPYPGVPPAYLSRSSAIFLSALSSSDPGVVM